jgi:hypothetical protein
MLFFAATNVILLGTQDLSSRGAAALVTFTSSHKCGANQNTELEKIDIVRTAERAQREKIEKLRI